jgi:hypothetical protein
MTMLAGELCSKFTLVDDEGNQLLQANYHRGGCLWVRVGTAYPVQSSFTVTPDGEFDLYARDDERRYEMLLRPYGESSVSTTDLSWGDFHGLGHNKEGELVVDQQAMWAVPEDKPGAAVNRGAAAGAGETTTSPPSADALPAASPATTVVPTTAGPSKSTSP